MRETLQPGLKSTFTYQVPPERTVPNLLPEAEEFQAMPEVLATGYLVGIVEWACMRALAEHLDPGEGSVGVHVDLSHDAPTLPGDTVTVDVEVVAVEGRVLTFTIDARDEVATIAAGRHRRAVIDVERFTARLGKRAAARV